ncbi:hypothetical protein CEXT_770681 [Caerostris extrusa]|uniref:Uncharacterized protein n=1 Tax=Caerostris extrusa TaxID=172846 RepID=A0AAV4NFH2_CAEEX|nr:hypothetical protein CEXT_770681 [Caerostris extrusa]
MVEAIDLAYAPRKYSDSNPGKWLRLKEFPYFLGISRRDDVLGNFAKLNITAQRWDSNKYCCVLGRNASFAQCSVLRKSIL